MTCILEMLPNLVWQHTTFSLYEFSLYDIICHDLAQMLLYEMVYGSEGSLSLLH
jgi:hypothetical protein